MNIAEKYMTDMELNEPSNPLEINKTEDKLKIKFPEPRWPLRLYLIVHHSKGRDAKHSPSKDHDGEVITPPNRDHPSVNNLVE